MKFYGDIPADHRALAEELVELESWFKNYGSGIPPLIAAKGSVCMAYDWYTIHAEEEGDRLIREAEKLCPGYFKSPIHLDVEMDREFAYLVEGLKKTLGLDLMKSLGFECE